MFLRFATGNWFQSSLTYFICAVDKKAYQLQNVKNFPLFYFAIFKLFYSLGWTLGSVLLSVFHFVIVCPFLSHAFVSIVFRYFQFMSVFLFCLCPCYFFCSLCILDFIVSMFLCCISFQLSVFLIHICIFIEFRYLHFMSILSLPELKAQVSYSDHFLFIWQSVHLFVCL